MTTTPTIGESIYFDRLAHVEAAHWWSASIWRLAAYWLDHALRGRRGLVALDVGCGAGGTIGRLAARPEIARVIGLDPGATALAHARRQASGLVRGDALALPLPAASVDLVTCFDVLQHLPPGGDRRAAAELRRVLRPGGVALIRANGRGLWPDPVLDPGPYRLAKLIDVITSAGLRIVQATYANALPSVAAELLGRFRPCRSMLATGHPAGRGLRIQVPGHRVNRLMTVIGATEAYLAGRLGVRLPVGHSTMVMAVANDPGMSYDKHNLKFEI